MVVLGGGRFFKSEVHLYRSNVRADRHRVMIFNEYLEDYESCSDSASAGVYNVDMAAVLALQAYLAHKNPPPLGSP